MKKSLSVLILVLIIASLTFSIASAASISILDIRMVPGKGLVFILSADGITDFKNATLTAGGNTYPLYCQAKDDGTVGCTANAQVGAAISNQSGFINVGGASASFGMPQVIDDCDRVAIWLYEDGSSYSAGYYFYTLNKTTVIADWLYDSETVVDEFCYTSGYSLKP